MLLLRASLTPAPLPPPSAPNKSASPPPLQTRNRLCCFGRDSFSPRSTLLCRCCWLCRSRGTGWMSPPASRSLTNSSLCAPRPKPCRWSAKCPISSTTCSAPRPRPSSRAFSAVKPPPLPFNPPQLPSSPVLGRPRPVGDGGLVSASSFSLALSPPLSGGQKEKKSRRKPVRPAQSPPPHRVRLDHQISWPL